MKTDAPPCPLTVFDCRPDHLTGANEFPFDRSLDRAQLFNFLDPAHWTQTFESDAHLCTYAIVSAGRVQPELPRLNMASLASIRDAGLSVVTTMLVLDYDSKDNVPPGILERCLPKGETNLRKAKVRWDDEVQALFDSKLADAMSALDSAGIARPNIIYRSTHGAKLVHLIHPQHWIPVDQTQPILLGLMKTYNDTGLLMDGACKEWNRMFRLPNVTRRDHQDGAHQDVAVDFDGGFTVPSTITPVGVMYSAPVSASAIQIDDDMPDPDECEAMLWREGAQGKRVRSDLMKAAKRLIADPELKEILFHDKHLVEGSRDTRLASMVGSVCQALCGKPGMTPALVMALFNEEVSDLDPDASTPDWRVCTWRMIRKFWVAELNKLKEKAQEAQVAAQQAEQLEEDLLQKTKAKSGDEALHSGDTVREEAAFRKLLILRSDSYFYVMGRDSNYSPATSGAELGTRVEMQDMTDLIPILKPLGGVMNGPDIANGCSTIIKSVVYRGSAQVSVLDKDNRLILPMYALDLATPTFTPEIAEWLTRLVPREDLDKFLKWLAYCLDFTGPICALSLKGAPGIGKDLLSVGLQECLKGKPIHADGAALVEGFNESMMNTPFVFANEGLPNTNSNSAMALSEVFRQRITGAPFRINEKYKPRVSVESFVRIIIAANSDNVVQKLAGQQILDSDDQAALAERLFHVECRPEAAVYLRGLGGRAYFEKSWVGPDSYTLLAKHLLWMHKHRAEYGKPDDRLLVSGDLDSVIAQKMRTRNPGVDQVCWALLDVVSKAASPQFRKFVSIVDGTIHVQFDTVFKRHQTETADSLRERKGRKLFKKLMHQAFCDPFVHKRLVTMAGDNRPGRWMKVNLKQLLHEAEELDYPIPEELEKML